MVKKELEINKTKKNAVCKITIRHKQELKQWATRDNCNKIKNKSYKNGKTKTLLFCIVYRSPMGLRKTCRRSGQGGW